MERLAFVFDRCKILFRHVAGEILLPKKKGKPVPQLNRTPFLMAFQAGWFKFSIFTVHIYYGSSSDLTASMREISDIADFFTERQKKDGEISVRLGDFNILNPKDATMKALLGHGFEVRPELRKPTALASGNFYDQIAMRTQPKLVEVEAAGCFHWNDYVFRDDDYAAYKPLITKGKTSKAAYEKWRTWQMSDHLPLKAEIKMDFTESYLDSLKSKAKAPLATFAPATGPRANAHGV